MAGRKASAPRTRRELFWPKERTLFVADPHFGKTATAFEKSGYLYLSTPLRMTVQVVTNARKNAGGQLVFSVIFFTPVREKLIPYERFYFNGAEACESVEIVLIRGNHDLNLVIHGELSIQCHAEPFMMKHLRHIPPIGQRKCPCCQAHPSGLFNQRDGKRKRTGRLFLGERESIILPAFGAFTGLKNIRPIPGK